jgi:6-phosphogluconolactonase (cycloisomerase 2 family)
LQDLNGAPRRFSERGGRSWAALGLTLALAACGGSSGSNNAIAPTSLDYDPLAVGTPTFSFEACDTIDTGEPEVDQPITNWSSTPALPTGLSLASDGSIVGIPEVIAAAQDFSIVAANAAGSTSQTVSIAIVAPPAPANLSYASDPVTYSTGVPIVPNVPTVTGNITSWSISPTLPAGLSLSVATGVISGTPTAVSASASYTVVAEDCLGGETNTDISIEVVAGGGGPLDTPRFVYTANSGDGTLSINALNPSTGKLTPIGYAYTGGSPVAVERSAGHDELFMLDRADGQVEVFAINPVSGQLTAITGSPYNLPANSTPNDFLLDGSRTRLFVANTGSNSISVYSVASDGALTQVVGSPFAVGGSEPVALALDPNEEFLFAACRASDEVSVFDVAVSGALSSEQLVTVADSPLTLDTLTASGGNRALYVGFGGTSNLVQTYFIGSTGGLTAGVPVTEVSGAVVKLDAVQFANNARAIYALNSTLGRVQRLGVLGTGQATVPFDTAPFYTGLDPVAIARTDNDGFSFVVFQGEASLSSASVDSANQGVLAPVAPTDSPTDRQRVRALPTDVVVVNGSDAPNFVTDALYAANFADGDISQFDYTGGPPTLVALAPATVSAGAGPNSIQVHPRLNKAYAIDTSDTLGQDILIYDIAVNGTLVTPPASVDLAAAGAAGSGGWSAAIDPSGRFLIVTRTAAVSQVISYPIDASGNLGSGLAATAGDTARGGAIDPTGRFFYVANSISNTVSQFSINPATGALTSIAAPIAAGSAPWSVTVHPTGRFVYVANFSGNSFSSYSIDAGTGALTLIQASGGGATTASQGNQPVDLLFERGGRILYVACEGTSEINRFLVNLNGQDATVDGTAFLFGEQTIGGTPRSIAIDGQNGAFFASLSGSGEVETYSFSVITGGALTLTDTDQAASATATRAVALRTRLL